MSDQPSIFVSYSHADTKWLKQLDPHLKGLEIHAKVERFDDRQLFGGDDWDLEVKAKLDQADIVLLLVTANFIGSDYIHRVELPTALKRREENGSVVVPVLFEDCARKLLAIDDIHYLPKDRSGALKPLAEWRGAQKASGLRQIIEHLHAQIERCRTRAEREGEAATISLRHPGPARPAPVAPEGARRPADEAEPPTRVVDARHRGDHAKPGRCAEHRPSR